MYMGRTRSILRLNVDYGMVKKYDRGEESDVGAAYKFVILLICPTWTSQNFAFVPVP